MQIFLVKACVERSEYMGTSYHFDDTRLVQAACCKEAELKFKNFWETKSDSYGTSYFVADCTVQETIV